MTWDERDPWALPPGVLRDQVENAIAAARERGLPAPTRFLPPFPDNQTLNAAQVAALREAGVAQTLGCSGEGLPALPLATLWGRPLAGQTVRFTPVWLLRAALARSASPALCLSPVDIDPGAPAACGPGRAWLMRRLPALLAGGFSGVAVRP
jgi:hypothetical protein